MLAGVLPGTEARGDSGKFSMITPSASPETGALGLAVATCSSRETRVKLGQGQGPPAPFKPPPAVCPWAMNTTSLSPACAHL